MLSKTLEGSEDGFSYASHRNKAMFPGLPTSPDSCQERPFTAGAPLKEQWCSPWLLSVSAEDGISMTPTQGFSCAAQPGLRNSSQHMTSSWYPAWTSLPQEKDENS